MAEFTVKSRIGSERSSGLGPILGKWSPVASLTGQVQLVGHLADVVSGFVQLIVRLERRLLSMIEVGKPWTQSGFDWVFAES